MKPVWYNIDIFLLFSKILFILFHLPPHWQKESAPEETLFSIFLFFLSSLSGNRDRNSKNVSVCELLLSYRKTNLCHQFLWIICLSGTYMVNAEGIPIKIISICDLPSFLSHFNVLSRSISCCISAVSSSSSLRFTNRNCSISSI